MRSSITCISEVLFKLSLNRKFLEERFSMLEVKQQKHGDVLISTGVAGVCHLAPTTSWFRLRSRASWEKSFTPGWENSDTHSLKAEEVKT